MTGMLFITKAEAMGCKVVRAKSTDEVDDTIKEDFTGRGEVDLLSGYASLRKRKIPKEFRFVVIHRLFSPSSECSLDFS